jgi:hypothetical protein
MSMPKRSTAPDILALTAVVSGLIQEQSRSLPPMDAKAFQIRLQSSAISQITGTRWLDAYDEARALNTVASLFPRA